MATFEETGLYQGVVKNLKNKKHPGKSPKILDFGDVSDCDGFSGVLKPNTVLLDADTEPHNEILQSIIKGEGLNCFMTDREGGRGVHVLMVNSNTSLKKADGVMLACGVVVDFHPSYSMKYECLKYQGIERKEIYNKPPYTELPKYFTPLPSKYNIDFSEMDEGDGRNSVLYSYILTLQGQGFSVEEIRETIGIINRYVLKKPLDDSELETVLRDEAFQKQGFYVKTKFLHDRFAEYIKSEHHVKKINGELHIYQDGIYIPGDKEIQRAMLKEISSLTSNQRREVLTYLNVVCEEEQTNADLNMIAFENGLYDINTGTLEPPNPNCVITNKIPWNYNPNAQSNLVDSVLNQMSCNDAEIRQVLEEVAGRVCTGPLLLVVVRRRCLWVINQTEKAHISIWYRIC